MLVLKATEVPANAPVKVSVVCVTSLVSKIDCEMSLPVVSTVKPSCPSQTSVVRLPGAPLKLAAGTKRT